MKRKTIILTFLLFGIFIFLCIFYYSKNTNNESKELNTIDLNTNYKEVDLNKPYDPDAGKPLKYIVQSGDTLWFLSKKYYRNPELWPLIASANEVRVNSKNNLIIEVGTEIVIPQRIPRTDYTSLYFNIKRSLLNGTIKESNEYKDDLYNFKLLHPNYWIFDFSKQCILIDNCYILSIEGPPYFPRIINHWDTTVSFRIYILENIENLDQNYFINLFVSNSEENKLEIDQLQDGGLSIKYKNCPEVCVQYRFYKNKNNYFLINFPSVLEVEKYSSKIATELREIINSFSLIIR